MSALLLLGTLGLLTQASYQEVQSPESLSVKEGESASMSCSGTRGVGDDMSWYLQKPGEAPKLLIYGGTTLETGISDRFSGSQSGLHFTLTISKAEPEDAGDYYCMGYYGSSGRTFGGGTRLSVGNEAQPVLTVLPPSKDEMNQGKATVMCVASKGFPSDWKLSWKLDDESKSSGVDMSPGVLQKDGLYSWTSSLTLTQSEWSSAKSISCEATQSSQKPVTKILDTQECGIE